MDNIGGYLEVGLNDNDEVVINHPDLKPDEDGVGHIVFSPQQARNLAMLLLKHADDAATASIRKSERLRRESAAKIPVDRNARCMTDGSPETPDHRDIDPATGQQKGYIVLSPEERAKGFVRPVRMAYRHKLCGVVTTMARSIAETYARDPGFYSGTFCIQCRKHFPLDQFVWEGTNERVGS